MVPTTLCPAMAKTDRIHHWVKYVSSNPTSLEKEIPTTSLVLQGKFHEAPNVAPTFSRFVCFGFRWRPLVLFSSTLGLWSSNASLTTMFSSSSLTSMVDFGHPMQLCFHLLLYPSTVTRKRFNPNACCKAKISRMETITKNQCSPQTASRAQKP